MTFSTSSSVEVESLMIIGGALEVSLSFLSSGGTGGSIISTSESETISGIGDRFAGGTEFSLGGLGFSLTTFFFEESVSEGGGTVEDDSLLDSVGTVT